MEPLEQIQKVRQELQRLAAARPGGELASAEMQEKLSQLHTELSRAEEHLRATLGKATPTKAELRAEGDKLVAEKMRRVEEIKALKKEHGANWVFVPTAEELAAAAVPPIAATEMPGLIRSMFEQLKIRPGGGPDSDVDSDREIWEDLSQIENEKQVPARPRPSMPMPPKAKPRKPAEPGEGEIWDDLSQMDDS